MNTNLIPLIYGKHEIPIVLWDAPSASMFILHGQKQQLVTKVIFDGMKAFSCLRTVECKERKCFFGHEQPIYNRNGKTVATYNAHNRLLTVWHEGKTTIIFLPPHTGMRWKNVVV